MSRLPHTFVGATWFAALLVALGTVGPARGASDACEQAHQAALSSGYYGSSYTLAFGRFDELAYNRGASLVSGGRGKVCSELAKAAPRAAAADDNPERLECLVSMLHQWDELCAPAVKNYSARNYDPAWDIARIDARREELALLSPGVVPIADSRLRHLRELTAANPDEARAAVARAVMLFADPSGALGDLSSSAGGAVAAVDPLLGSLPAKSSPSRRPSATDFASWTAIDVRKSLLSDPLHDPQKYLTWTVHDFDRAQVLIPWMRYDAFKVVPPLSGEETTFELRLNRRLMEADQQEAAARDNMASSDASVALAARLDRLDVRVRPWSILFLAAGADADVVKSSDVQEVVGLALAEAQRQARLQPEDIVGRVRSLQAKLDGEEFRGARDVLRGITTNPEDKAWLKNHVAQAEAQYEARRETERHRQAEEARIAAIEADRQQRERHCESVTDALQRLDLNSCAIVHRSRLVADGAACDATVGGLDTAYTAAVAALARMEPECTLGSSEEWSAFYRANRDSGLVYAEQVTGGGSVIVVGFRFDRSWRGLLPQDDALRRLLDLACEGDPSLLDLLAAEGSEEYLNGGFAIAFGRACKVTITKQDATMVGKVEAR